jgi:hypothetical protein
LILFVCINHDKEAKWHISLIEKNPDIKSLLSFCVVEHFSHGEEDTEN